MYFNGCGLQETSNIYHREIDGWKCISILALQSLKLYVNFPTEIGNFGHKNRLCANYKSWQS